FAHNIATLDQPPNGFVDLIGWKFSAKFANNLPKALSSPYRGRERTIKFPVKKELSMFRIKTYDIVWQEIDGEIRRELRNVLAVKLLRAVTAIICHEIGTRASRLLAASVDHHRKVMFLRVATAPSSSSAPAICRYKLAAYS